MGIMTTISVIIIAIIFITIIGFGAQGRSELYHILRSRPLATGRQTPNQQQPWKGAQPTATSGEGQGGTHTTGKRCWGPTERGHIYYHYGLRPQETTPTTALGTYGEGPYYRYGLRPQDTTPTTALGTYGEGPYILPLRAWAPRNHTYNGVGDLRRGAIYDPGSRFADPPPPMVSPPPTLPKPKLYDSAHVFHMRAPKATTVTRIASQDARSV